MTVAFVFQGGASLAAVQVGMARALVEAGIWPDLVVGSSAGALNAVAYAQDPTPAGLEDLQRLWAAIRRSDVLPLGVRSLLAGLTGRRNSLIASDRLRALIQRSQNVHDLRETAIPAHVVATDAATGDPVVMSEGPVVQALLASAAIPGILPPVPWRERLLIDGSLSADIPILQAEGLGATTSYVLPSVPGGATPGSPSAGIVPILIRTMNMLLERSAVGDLAAAQGHVHVLPAPVVRGLNPLDFRHSAELIRLGHHTTQRWLIDNTQMAA